MHLVCELLFNSVGRLLEMILIEIYLFWCSRRSFLLFLVNVTMSVSYSPVFCVVFQCFPGQWSEECESRSVVAEKTLGFVPEYIKDVGDSVDLVFINNFDFTRSTKKCTETL